MVLDLSGILPLSRRLFHPSTGDSPSSFHPFWEKNHCPFCVGGWDNMNPISAISSEDPLAVEYSTKYDILEDQMPVLSAQNVLIRPSRNRIPRKTSASAISLSSYAFLMSVLPVTLLSFLSSLQRSLRHLRFLQLLPSTNIFNRIHHDCKTTISGKSSERPFG
jgi:hypothetical protein